MLRDLLEFTSPALASSRIDAEQRIIRNCVIFGSKESANGYRYSEKAVNRLHELASGSKVYIDHESTDEARSRQGVRSMQHFAGVIQNPQRKGEKVTADWHVAEAYWPLAKDLATMVPDRVGFSIACKAYTATENGKEVVMDVHSLKSVDIVSEGAVIQNLFEGLQTRREVKEKETGDPKIGTIIDIRESEILIDCGGEAPLYIEKKKLSFIPRVGQECTLSYEPTTEKRESKKETKEAEMASGELRKMLGITDDEGEVEDRDLAEQVLNAGRRESYREEAVTSELYAHRDLPERAPINTELSEENVLECITSTRGIEHGAGDPAAINPYHSSESQWIRRIQEQKPAQQTAKEVEEADDEESEILEAFLRR